MEAKAADQTGRTWHQTVIFKQGIETDAAKKIVKLTVKTTKWRFKRLSKVRQSSCNW